jgi:hypothetical protein
MITHLKKSKRCERRKRDSGIFIAFVRVYGATRGEVLTARSWGSEHHSGIIGCGRAKHGSSSASTNYPLVAMLRGCTVRNVVATDGPGLQQLVADVKPGVAEKKPIGFVALRFRALAKPPL